MGPILLIGRRRQQDSGGEVERVDLNALGFGCVPNQRLGVKALHPAGPFPQCWRVGLPPNRSGGSPTLQQIVEDGGGTTGPANHARRSSGPAGLVVPPPPASGLGS